MEAVLTPSPGGVRVAFRGGDALDAANAEEVKGAILPALRVPQDVVVDLREIDFIDSAGVGVLVAIYRSVRSSGGRTRFCRLQPGVRAVLSIIRLDDIFEIADDPVGV